MFHRKLRLFAATTVLVGTGWNWIAADDGVPAPQPVTTAVGTDAIKSTWPLKRVSHSTTECVDASACGEMECGSCEGSDCSYFDRLTGFQADLAEHGITYNAALTQFYQGVAHGGANETFKYGGKVDQFFNFDGQKLGLWEGLFVSMHAETRFGEDVNLDAVGLAPVNAAMLYPNAFDHETAITGFTITQALSETFLVTVGKFNLLDLFNQLYPETGRGIDGFMNISALAPLSVARPLNLSIMGAGVSLLNEEGQVQGSFSVLDTHNSATTSGFDQLFDDGAVLVGYWRLFSEINGLAGSHGLMGVYSSGEYTSVDPLTWAFVPDVGVVAGQESGTWNLTYFYQQKLWVDECDANRNISLLTSWGISDGNPNPISWACNVGVQGKGVWSQRPEDAVGVAYFHTGLSSDFERLLSPLLTVDDINGVELYYNAAITPWFHLTPDLQIIEPADVSNDTAVVVGLRGKLEI